MNVKTNPHLYAERSRSRHLLHRRTRITDVKGKTKATGAKGKTKATDLKEFLSNLATDPWKLGEFLHAPEPVMSAANLSEADKTALRSGVSGMVAARLAGVPLDQETPQIGPSPEPPQIGPSPEPPQIGPSPTPPPTHPTPHPPPTRT